MDSTLPRCSVSFRSPGFPSSMLLTRDSTCFSRSSILLWSRSLRLFACTELLLLLNCCQERGYNDIRISAVLICPFHFYQFTDYTASPTDAALSVFSALINLSDQLLQREINIKYLSWPIEPFLRSVARSAKQPQEQQQRLQEPYLQVL